MNDKPWIKFYDPGVPASFQPYPEKTLIDVLQETARQRPEHPALVFKGASISYAELDQSSNALAAALHKAGVQKGDRVAMLMPNCPQLVISFFGAWKAGAIVAPLNPLYTEHELVYTLNECSAETVIVLTPFYQKIKNIQTKTRVGRVIATNIKEYLPPVLRFLFTLAKEKKEGHRIHLNNGDVWLQDLLKGQRGAARPTVPVGPADSANLMFSGGTTGTPKAAICNHHAFIMSGMQLHAWFSVMIEDWKDISFAALPLFHVYANLGVMSEAFIGHNPLVLAPNPRDLKDLLATIKKSRPSVMPGVPTLFTALINHPDVQAGKADLSSIKLCVAGAAPLLLETKHRFEALTGGRIVEGYALTETMMATVVTPVKGVYKPGAVGIPLPDVEVRIVDAEYGELDLPPCQTGEILIRAPQLMRGYWQQPTETNNILRAGWLYTGDLGYMDEDGYLYIVDRKKDVIKASGFQVWPREVEEVIAQHPAVGEVGVAGIPDAYQVEAVKAWVVLRPGMTVSEAELREYCHENLASYKVPKFIEMRDSLPKSTVGKVLRRELANSEKMKQPAD
jgi:long-chain acyl-CoA synthetase